MEHRLSEDSTCKGVINLVSKPTLILKVRKVLNASLLKPQRKSSITVGRDNQQYKENIDLKLDIADPYLFN